MSLSTTRLSGTEWQDWADLLLHRRYGPAQYQKIPATDSGDAGIEGFTLCGHAYQAYGCVEPLSTEARYEKQREKMTTDIGKFITNRAKLQAVLGTISISRWCLFVPHFDGRRIVAHAATKTEEVVAANLPYVTQDFRVMVCDEGDFAVERDALADSRPAQISVEGLPTTAQHVQDWSGDHTSLVDVLDEKIAKLPTIRDPGRRTAFREKMIKHFLDGQNVLDAMRRDYPKVYERLHAAKTDRENYLETDCMVATGTANQILNEALEMIKRTFREEVPNVSSKMVDAVAYGAIADWLLRCPLDFPEVNQDE